MADETAYLELLSVPIVDDNGNASEYFEDAWFQLIQSMGGEEGPTTVDILNLINQKVDAKINNLFRRVSDIEQHTKKVLSLNSVVNGLRREVNGIEQTIKNVSALKSILNVARRDISDLNQLSIQLLSKVGRLTSTVSNIGFKVLEVPTGGTTATTSGNQIVICNNTGAATVTLNATPKDKEEVYVKRLDDAVTVSGSIDGAGSSVIAAQYDFLHLFYTIAAGEWSIM